MSKPEKMKIVLKILRTTFWLKPSNELFEILRLGFEAISVIPYDRIDQSNEFEPQYLDIFHN